MTLDAVAAAVLLVPLLLMITDNGHALREGFPWRLLPNDGIEKDTSGKESERHQRTKVAVDTRKLLPGSC